MRLKNSKKNLMYSILFQLLMIAMSFTNRTIFIFSLGEEYLGVAGFISNILSMLSLAELGLGTAITFQLYEPLANKEYDEVSKLLGFYRVAYMRIAFVVFTLGIVFLPFIDSLIMTRPNVEHFNIIYLLFLTNTVLSYLFAYKRTLFTADQKEYVNVINRSVFQVFQNALQIVVLLTTSSYICYLLVLIISTWLSNLDISIKSKKVYPFLKSGSKLAIDESKKIMRYVYAQMSHKIGGVIVTGTDNLLISAFTENGITFIGLYSNYVLIVSIVKQFVNLFFTSIIASVGNLNTTSTREYSMLVFDRIFFINQIIISISSVSILTLSNDFILLWLGRDYVLEYSLLVVVCTNFYMMGMRQTCIVFNTTLGLFWNDRFKPIFESVINLIASIVLLKVFGVIGVFIGTFTSTLLTSFWVEPKILYDNYFKVNVRRYFIKYTRYLFTTFVQLAITITVVNRIYSDSIVTWVFKALIVILIQLIITFIIYNRDSEYKYCISLMKQLMRKVQQ